jgi:hypothetical protein
MVLWASTNYGAFIMDNPSDQYNFSKFLDRIRGLEVAAMLKEADDELYGVSYPSKPRGHKSAAASSRQKDAQGYASKYMNSLRGFHFLFGTTCGTIKPEEMDKDDFQLLKPIAERLVSEKAMPPGILRFFT